MFISPAYATDAATTAAAGTQSGASIVMTLAPLLIVFLIFYVFLVRPQQKRMAEYQRLVSGLRRGDRVVTTGGIIGTISKIEPNGHDVMVEIAEGVRVRVQRSAIAEILAKTSSVSGDTDVSGNE